MGVVQAQHQQLLWGERAGQPYSLDELSVPPAAVRVLLSGMGFEEVAWGDVTDGSAPVAGPQLGAMFHSHVRNLEEWRIVVIQGV